QARLAELRAAGVPMRGLAAALAPLIRDLRAARPLPTAAGEYHTAAGCIFHTRQTAAGPVEERLANFTAHIAQQVTHDDGAGRSIRLAVEGALDDGSPLPRVEIPAEDFARMEWTIPKWGTQAVVGAGRGTADHLRAALQLLSGSVPQR